ncbi:MAG: alpha/beta hydrolase [Turneriella sp.]
MFERNDIAFASGNKDELCRGWLYLPQAPKGKLPAVVMAHGFGAVKELRLDAYAEKFVAAGFAVLVFDYRHFGQSEGEPRQLIDIGQQLEDWRAALLYIRHHSAVDANRIALWGTSFAGGHVVEIAATDQKVRCVISQVPHLDGFASASMAGGTQAARLAMEAARDAASGLIGLEPHYVKVAGSAGELAAMTSDNVATIWPRMIPQGFSFDNRVAARIFLHLPLYSPERCADKMTMPWLIQVATKDQTTPVGPAERAAARAPKATLIQYDADHFDVYLPPLFDTVVAAQVEFLRTHL